MGMSADRSARTPTQLLVLDVLAARRHIGEQAWTFPRYRPTIKALNALERAGLVWWKGGSVQGTVLAGLTDAGLDVVVSPSYAPPRLQSPEECAAAGDGHRFEECCSRCGVIPAEWFE